MSYSNGTKEQPITQMQYGIKNYKLIAKSDLKHHQSSTFFL